MSEKCVECGSENLIFSARYSQTFSECKKCGHESVSLGIKILKTCFHCSKEFEISEKVVDCAKGEHNDVEIKDAVCPHCYAINQINVRIVPKK